MRSKPYSSVRLQLALVLFLFALILNLAGCSSTIATTTTATTTTTVTTTTITTTVPLTLIHTDGAGDWDTPTGGAPPGGVYHYPPTDVVTLSAGADSQYLYLRYDVAGEMPTIVAATFENQEVHTAVINCEIKVNNEIRAGIFYSININPNNNDDAPVQTLDWQNSPSSQTGGDEGGPEYTTSGTGEILAGGMGYNYVTLQLLLSDLGLTGTEEISFYPWAESASAEWHHFSFDRLSVYESLQL